LSRSKRYIYNVGTQVPLIVRVPEKWRHLAPGAPGSVNEMIAQFVDFPKTALALAGIERPALMQGRILFGAEREPPARYAHFYRDRMAERHDCSRAVTDGRYYLIRNFVPHRPRGRDSQYGHSVQANWGVWQRWYDGNPEAAGALRSQFFKPKPPLELFDTQRDPWHVNNLAGAAQYSDIRKILEAELDAFQIQVRDVGLVPESLIYDLAGPGTPYGTIYEFAQSGAYDAAKVLRAAQSASLGDAARRDDYLTMTEDADAVVRYYGAYALFLLRDGHSRIQEALKKMARSDPSAGNRVMAAQALGFCGGADLAFEVIKKEAESAAGRGYVYHAAINALQYAHLDNRLSREDWLRFQELSKAGSTAGDTYGFDYARRIIDDALKLWPQRRRVD
jgi:N-sulfoglucosamine sulfohydrolase